MAEAKTDEKAPITAVISVIVLIIAVGVSLASSSISREAFLLLSAGLFLSATVLFAGLLYKPLAHYTKAKWLTRKHDRVARRNIEELKSHVEGLNAVYNSRQMTSLVYSLASLGGRAEFSKIPNLNSSSTYMELLCGEILNGLHLIKPSKATLVWGVNVVNWVLRMFNDGMIIPAVREIRAVSDQNPQALARGSKDSYNTNRLSYIRFLDNYDEFITRANKEFGPPERVKLSPNFGTMFEGVLRHAYIEKPTEL